MGQNIKFAVMIIISQIIGAILGCVSTWMAQYKDPITGALKPGIGHLAPPQPKDALFERGIKHGGLGAFWAEMILTAYFVSVILTAKYLNGATDLFLNGLVIGLTLFTAVTAGGGVSGGCFNPAVGLV